MKLTRRDRRGLFVFGIAVAAIVALRWQPAAIALAVVVGVAIGYALPRPSRRPAPRGRQQSEFARRKAAAATTAPRTGKLAAVPLSPQCATGDCFLCEDKGCKHGCGHTPASIVAANERAYDAAHTDDDKPPF